MKEFAKGIQECMWVERKQNRIKRKQE